MYKQALIIDGVSYNVPLVKIDMDYSFLEKYANRTEDGDIKIETIGGYLNYTVELGVIEDRATFKKMFAQITDPNKRFHNIQIPSDTGYDEFYGYFSSIKASVQRVLDEGVTYSGFSFKMTAQKPTRR